MVTILMLSAELATPGLIKIKIFYVVMLPKLGNSGISVRETIVTSILEGFSQDFWGVPLVQIQ